MIRNASEEGSTKNMLAVLPGSPHHSCWIVEHWKQLRIKIAVDATDSLPIQTVAKLHYILVIYYIHLLRKHLLTYISSVELTLPDDDDNDDYDYDDDDDDDRKKH